MGLTALRIGARVGTAIVLGLLLLLDAQLSHAQPASPASPASPAPPSTPAAPSAPVAAPSGTPQPSAPPAAGSEADETARAEAKAQFQAGVAAYEAERYEEALGHFQEAFRIKPHPSVRVNMANCYERLGKPLQAIFHFERFLEDKEGAVGQRREVMEALRGLRAKVSEVTLRVAPDGASITIDAGERRQAPMLEPVRLEAGLHLIEVALSGYETVKREVMLTGGEPTELSITLERSQVGAPIVAPEPLLPESVTGPAAEEPSLGAEPSVHPVAKPEAPAPAQGPSKSLLPVAGWIVGSATAAVLVAALITGQLALSAEADFENSRETVLDTTSTPIERRIAFVEAAEAADRADGLALTSDILLGTAVVGAAVTVVLAIRHHSSDEEPTALTFGPNGAAFAARF